MVLGNGTVNERVQGSQILLGGPGLAVSAEPFSQTGREAASGSRSPASSAGRTAPPVGDFAGRSPTHAATAAASDSQLGRPLLAEA
jgi:hypothetical protein